MLTLGIDGVDVGKEIGSGTMTEVEWLIRILKDKDNCNILDYVDDAIDIIERLSKKLEVAQDLAERRLQRKNMYKERSERSLFEKERYRLDLEQVKRERDAAISDLIGECTVCKNSNECTKYPCYCINGSAWEWRGVPEK